MALPALRVRSRTVSIRSTCLLHRSLEKACCGRPYSISCSTSMLPDRVLAMCRCVLQAIPAQSITLGFHLVNLARRFWQLPGGAVMSGHLHTWRTTSCPPTFYMQKLTVLQVGAFSADQPQNEAAFTFPLASTASAALLASDPGPNPHLLLGLEPCCWGLQGWSLRLVFRTIAVSCLEFCWWSAAFREHFPRATLCGSQHTGAFCP